MALGQNPAKVWRGAEIGELRLSVELCAMYWHFLLFVWLVLFGLLTGWADEFIDICRQIADLGRRDQMAETDADTYRANRLRGLQAGKASPPTGPRISARSRTCPGARP